MYWYRSPVKSASKEMQTMIQEGSNDAERFGELVDILLDSELPYKEASLAGGEWQVGMQRMIIKLEYDKMIVIYC